MELKWDDFWRHSDGPQKGKDMYARGKATPKGRAPNHRNQSLLNNNSRSNIMGGGWNRGGKIKRESGRGERTLRGVPSHLSAGERPQKERRAPDH